jgi:hypothetical protein
MNVQGSIKYPSTCCSYARQWVGFLPSADGSFHHIGNPFPLDAKQNRNDEGKHSILRNSPGIEIR